MLEFVTRKLATTDTNEFVLSDNQPDRMGDVVETSGWQIGNFNPVALLNHSRDAIIGKWEKVRVAGNELRGSLRFADAGTSAVVDMARALFDQDLLDTVSVGFRALDKEPLDPKDPYGPQRFKRSELLEASLVSVPANPRARRIVKQFLTDEQLASVYGRDISSFAGGNAKPEAKGKAMLQSGTLAQRITAAHDNLNAMIDRLADITGKEQPSEDEARRGEELPDEIETAKHHLDTLERQERALGLRVSSHSGTAQVVMPSTVRIDPPPIRAPMSEAKSGEIIEPRRMFAVGKKKPDPADYVWRSLAVWSGSQSLREPLEKVLQEKYGGDEMTGVVLRAAINPAMTTVAGWAAELVQTVNVDFLDRLIPNFIYPAISNAGTRYTFGNNGSLKIPGRTTSSTLAGAWVGEGAPKPVKKLSFTSVPLTPFKMAVISTFTEEMALYGTPAIEGIIRQAMSDDTGISLDTYLIDNVAASSVRPAGLLNGVTPIAASAATPATAAMVADLKALVAAIVAAGGGRNIVILLNPAQALSLGFAQTTTGDFLFSDVTEAGTKFGVRFIVSQTVTAGRVIAVDAADFATATGDTPRFAVSNEATLHEEDTTPLALSATGTPNVVAAPMRSLFQTDTVAIRMTLYVTWAMRRAGMVQTIASVSW